MPESTPSLPSDVLTAALPLERRFLRRVLPVLLVGALLGGLVGLWGVQTLVTQAYLGSARRHAGQLLQTVRNAWPGAWREWTESLGAAPPVKPSAGAQGAFMEVMQARGLTKLKIYDARGQMRLSSVDADWGHVERGGPLDVALQSGGDVARRIDSAEGPQMELYVHLPAQTTQPELLVELYEPADWFDSYRRLLVWPALLAGVLLLVATAWLARFVRLAQRELDARAVSEERLLDQLRSLVSRRAAASAFKDARSTRGGPEASVRVLDATLYYADLYDFTGLAETTRPDELVSLLNRVFDLQVQRINEFGGDVDKFIGDAVLAVFTGERRAERAVLCAQAVLYDLLDAGLPRGLHIGVHDGPVISGRLGSLGRQDDTVIGDAVNVSARLSALASVGTLACDTATVLRASLPEGFSAPHEVHVKGRQEPIRVRIWAAEQVRRADQNAYMHTGRTSNLIAASGGHILISTENSTENRH